MLDDYTIDYLNKKSENNKYAFNFKITKAIAIVIQVLFIYYENLYKIKDKPDLIIKIRSITEYKKIMQLISKKWDLHVYDCFHMFFPYNIINQIYTMRYYITELTLPFIEDTQNFNIAVHRSIQKNDISIKIRKYINMMENVLPFKIYKIDVIKIFDESIKNYTMIENEIFTKRKYSIRPLNKEWNIFKKNDKFYITYKNIIIYYNFKI